MVLRFFMSLREIFPNSIPFAVVINYKKECYCADFSGAWDRLPCCLSKGLLKWDFSDICLTTSFLVLVLENTSAMRVISFKKNVQNLI